MTKRPWWERLRDIAVLAIVIATLPVWILVVILVACVSGDDYYEDGEP